jgi:hypothetical protein
MRTLEASLAEQYPEESQVAEPQEKSSYDESQVIGTLLAYMHESGRESFPTKWPVIYSAFLKAMDEFKDCIGNFEVLQIPEPYLPLIELNIRLQQILGNIKCENSNGELAFHITSTYSPPEISPDSKLYQIAEYISQRI